MAGALLPVELTLSMSATSLPQAKLPALPKRFKLGVWSGVPAFGAPLHDYAKVSCYDCAVPLVIDPWG